MVCASIIIYDINRVTMHLIISQMGCDVDLFIKVVSDDEVSKYMKEGTIKGCFLLQSSIERAKDFSNLIDQEQKFVFWAFLLEANN